MLTKSVPSNREAVVQLVVSNLPTTAPAARTHDRQPSLVSRKPAPDATQATAKVDYTVVRFSY